MAVKTTGQAQDDHSPNCIALTVTAKNSLGATANKDDVSAIHLFAPLATLVVDSTSPDIDADSANNDGTVNIGGEQAVGNLLRDERGGRCGRSHRYRAVGDSGSSDICASSVVTFTGAASTITGRRSQRSAIDDRHRRYRAADDSGDVNCDANNVRVDSGTQACTEIKANGVANFEVTAGGGQGWQCRHATYC